MDEIVEPDLKWPSEPYPGLRPFRVTLETDETLIYYGRDRHKDEILARLDKQQMVFVTGPSGCGKSSLILAGVLPVLRAGFLSRAGSDWNVVSMRPGLRPVEQLCASISRLIPADAEITRELLLEDPSAFWILADEVAGASAHEPHRILLFIDQFEDIFGADVPADQVDQLVRLIVKYRERPHPLMYVMIAMRSDFLGLCTKFQGLAQAINETQFLTPILGLRELTEAIVRPAEDYCATIEKPLLDRLLTDMRPGAEYDPDNLALLQHALQWLWRDARARSGVDPSAARAGRGGGAVRLDLHSYEAAGGLKGILNRHADAVADGLPAEEASVLRAALTRLAEKSPTGGYRRSPASIDAIVAVTGRGEAVRQLIDHLSGWQVEFLETKSIRSGALEEPVVDLCHEALIRTWAKYRGWVDEEDFRVTILRRAANDAMHWDEHGRRDEHLDGGPTLALRRQRWQEWKPAWADRYQWSTERPERLSGTLPLIDAYLTASGARAEAERRRHVVLEARARRLTAGIVLGSICVLVFFLGWSLYNLTERAKEKQLERQELKADAARITIIILSKEALTQNKAYLSLLLAREGLTTLPQFTTDFDEIIYNSLQRLHLLGMLTAEKDITSVIFSPDKKYLLALRQDANVDFLGWGGEKIANFMLPDEMVKGFPFAQARWSRQGELIVFSNKGAVTVISVCDQVKELAKKMPSCEGAPMRIRDPIVMPFADQITKAQFSPDGKTLVIQTGPTFFSEDKTMLFDVEKLIASDGKANAETTIDGTTLAAAFSDDGSELAVGLANGGVRIYRTSDLPVVRELRVPRERAVPILSLSFLGASNEQIVSGSFLGGVRWNMGTGKAQPFFGPRDGPVFQLAAARDGTWIARSADGGKVIIRSARHKFGDRNSPPDIELGPHPGNVRTFDVGGSDLIATASVSMIYIWGRRAALSPRVSPAASDARAETAQQATSRDGSARLTAYSGRFTAIADPDGPVYLYDSSAQTPIATFNPPDGSTMTWTSLRFDPDHSEIVATSDRGEHVAWPYFATTESLLSFVDAHIPKIDGKPETLDPQTLCLITPEGPGCQEATP